MGKGLKLRYIRTAAGGIWQALLRLQEGILIVASVLFVSDIFIDVIMRYVIRKPLLGIEELAPVFALWVYFIGASYASHEHSHIYAGLMHVLLKNKQRASSTMTVVAGAITFGLSCYGIVLAHWLLMWGIERGEHSIYLSLSETYLQSSVFAGFILMSLYFLTELIKNTRECSFRWAKVGEEVHG